MPSLKIAAALVGIVLIFVAALGYLSPDRLHAVLPLTWDSDSSETNIETTSSVQVVTASTMFVATTTVVDVSYDSPIKMGSTLIIRCKIYQYTSFFCPDDPGSCPESFDRQRLPWPIEISIATPAFEIAEGGGAKQFDQGVRLPIEISWLAFPKSSGDQSIILDVSKVHRPRDMEPQTSWPHEYGHYTENVFNEKFYVNGEEVGSSEVSFTDIPMQVQVDTIWGIEERLSKAIFGFIGFIGASLVAPIIGEWTKRKYFPPASTPRNVPPIGEPRPRGWRKRRRR
jgi:hypothetical protein